MANKQKQQEEERPEHCMVAIGGFPCPWWDSCNEVTTDCTPGCLRPFISGGDCQHPAQPVPSQD